jgi:hypothetical protein
MTLFCQFAPTLHVSSFTQGKTVCLVALLQHPSLQGVVAACVGAMSAAMRAQSWQSVSSR